MCMGEQCLCILCCISCVAALRFSVPLYAMQHNATMIEIVAHSMPCAETTRADMPGAARMRVSSPPPSGGRSAPPKIDCRPIPGQGCRKSWHERRTGRSKEMACKNTSTSCPLKAQASNASSQSPVQPCPVKQCCGDVLRCDVLRCDA